MNTIKRSLDLQSIALEADVLANLVSTVKNYFPSLISELEPAVASLLGFKDKYHVNGLEVSKRDLAILNMPGFRNASYEEVSHTKFDCPEGVVADLVSFSDHVVLSLSYYNEVTRKAIEDFYVNLASVVSNKDAKISLQDNTKLYKEYQNKREDLMDGFSKLYKKGSTEAVTTFGRAFESKETLSEFFNYSKKIDELLSATDTQKVVSRVNDVFTLAKTFTKLAEENKIDRLSPQVVKNISEGLFELAQQIEFFSVSYYRAMTLTTTVNSLRDKLEKNFKNR